MCLVKVKGIAWLAYASTDGRQLHSSNLFATSALEEASGMVIITSRRLDLRERDPVPDRGLGGHQGPSGQVLKILPHGDSIPGPSGLQRIATLYQCV